MWVPAPAESATLRTRLPSSSNLTFTHSYNSGDMGNLSLVPRLSGQSWWDLGDIDTSKIGWVCEGLALSWSTRIIISVECKGGDTGALSEHP